MQDHLTHRTTIVVAFFGFAGAVVTNQTGAWAAALMLIGAAVLAVALWR